MNPSKIEDNKRKKESLKKTSLIYAAGNVSVLIIKFLFVPIYTFYLTEEVLGLFDLITSTAPLIVFVFALHIEMALLRFGMGNADVVEKTKVFTNSTAIFLAGMLLFTCIYYTLLYSGVLNIPQLSNYTLLYFYFISIFIYIFFKQVVRTIKSSFHFILMEIVYTLLLVVFIYWYIIANNSGINGLLKAYIYASIIVLLVWVFLAGVFKFFDVNKFEYSLVKKLLGYSSPLVLNSLNLWGLNYFIKYIILFFLTVSSNGIFAVAYKLGFSIQMISKIFNMAWLDKAVSSYEDLEFKNSINGIFNKFIKLFFSVSLGVIAFQRIVMKYFIGSDFFDAAQYIPFLAVGFFFMGLGNFLGVLYQCEMKTFSIAKSSLLASLAIIILGVSLTPFFELYGASIAFMIGNGIFFFYRYFDIGKLIELKINYGYYLLFVALWVFVYWLSFDESIGIYLAVIISLASFLVLNLGLIKSLLKGSVKNTLK
jgi:O-antigen/teichoic acid export membrane protein